MTFYIYFDSTLRKIIYSTIREEICNIYEFIFILIFISCKSLFLPQSLIESVI